MATLLGNNASKFLFSSRQFVEFKFNESAILQGIQENNPFAQRLFKEVFDSDIKIKKKNSTKNKIKKKTILQQTTMMMMMNWKMWRVMKDSDKDETYAMSCYEN